MAETNGMLVRITVTAPKELDRDDIAQLEDWAQSWVTENYPEFALKGVPEGVEGPIPPPQTNPQHSTDYRRSHKK